MKDSELIQEAQNEAIKFALLDLDGCGLDFLKRWVDEDWPEIQEQWPEFNLHSEAQLYLITGVIGG